MFFESLSKTPLVTDKPWQMPVSWSKGQFNHLHRAVVVNLSSGVAVQGEYSHAEAARAAQVLSEHNQSVGIPDKYGVFAIPVALHNQPPILWG